MIGTKKHVHHTIEKNILTDCSGDKLVAIEREFKKRFDQAFFKYEKVKELQTPFVTEGLEEAKKQLRKTMNARLTLLGKKCKGMEYSFMVTIQRCFYRDQNRWYLLIAVAIEVPGAKTFYAFSDPLMLHEIVSQEMDINTDRRFAAMERVFPGWKKERSTFYEAHTKTSERGCFKQLLLGALSQCKQ